jgi:hypothetical protein
MYPPGDLVWGAICKAWARVTPRAEHGYGAPRRITVDRMRRLLLEASQRRRTLVVGCSALAAPGDLIDLHRLVGKIDCDRNPALVHSPFLDRVGAKARLVQRILFADGIRLLE